MSKLISKNDYFKHTTRKILTEQEKRKTIEAVNRAVRLYISNSNSNLEVMCSGNGRTMIRNLNSIFRNLSIMTILVKGSTQPRNLYSWSRRNTIEAEARKIATETGAEYAEVRGLFMRLMSEYVIDNR